MGPYETYKSFSLIRHVRIYLLISGIIPLVVRYLVKSLLYLIIISGKFSVKTDAVVRSVTVLFKLGEQIDDETTVG